jgi:hypothetical protein
MLLEVKAGSFSDINGLTFLIVTLVHHLKALPGDVEVRSRVMAQPVQ